MLCGWDEAKEYGTELGLSEKECQRQKDRLHFTDIKKQTTKQIFPNGNRKGELLRSGRKHITTGDIGGNSTRTGQWILGQW